MSQCKAPWTADQVASLNGYQQCGMTHPFTGTRDTDGEQVDLIATPDGWVEQEGGPVVQTWAHTFMADWSWKKALDSLWDTWGEHLKKP